MKECTCSGYHSRGSLQEIAVLWGLYDKAAYLWRSKPGKSFENILFTFMIADVLDIQR